MKKALITAAAMALSGSVFAQAFQGATTLQHAAQDRLQYIDAPADYFTGKARFARYPRVDESGDGWAIVDFGAGAINNWHSHSKGQYLIITQGTGLVQEWGKPVQIVRKGDAVWFPPDVKHWHGAAPGQTMSHIAIAPTKRRTKPPGLSALTRKHSRPSPPKPTTASSRPRRSPRASLPSSPSPRSLPQEKPTN